MTVSDEQARQVFDVTVAFVHLLGHAVAALDDATGDEFLKLLDTLTETRVAKPGGDRLTSLRTLNSAVGSTAVKARRVVGLIEEIDELDDLGLDFDS